VAEGELEVGACETQSLEGGAAGGEGVLLDGADGGRAGDGGEGGVGAG
jgi:hypothetical protein